MRDSNDTDIHKRATNAFSSAFTKLWLGLLTAALVASSGWIVQTHARLAVTESRLGNFNKIDDRLDKIEKSVENLRLIMVEVRSRFSTNVWYTNP